MKRSTCTINYGASLPLAQGVNFDLWNRYHILIQLHNYSLIRSSKHISIWYLAFIFLTPPFPKIFLYFSPNSSKCFSLSFSSSNREPIYSSSFSFFSSCTSSLRIIFVFFCAFSTAWSDYFTKNINVLDDFFFCTSL